MDRSLLVAFDLAIGQQVLDSLEANGYKLAVAAWVVLGEYGDARLLLASRNLNQQSGLAATEQVFAVLREAAIDFFRLPPLHILKVNDPLIRTLRQTFGGSSDCGMQAPRSFAGHWMEEMYIYRILR